MLRGCVCVVGGAPICTSLLSLLAVSACLILRATLMASNLPPCLILRSLVDTFFKASNQDFHLDEEDEAGEEEITVVSASGEKVKVMVRAGTGGAALEPQQAVVPQVAVAE